MQELIAADLPFTREKIHTEEAVRLFRNNHREEKAILHESRGKFFTTVYYLDGYADHFYGPLTESTGVLKTFVFESFSRGFLLNIPTITSPYEIKKSPYHTNCLTYSKNILSGVRYLESEALEILTIQSWLTDRET